MISRLKDQLSGDSPVAMAWCGMRDAQLVGMIAREKFSAVLLDAQHGFHNEASFAECIPQVVAAGKSPLARIPVGRWDLVERLLDFGVLGVVAPMINNAEDARSFAQAAKYPGVGSRSFGPRHAASLYGISADEYVISANQCTFALAQIETLEAYENLDAILSTQGIDGVLMGPADFSISVTGNPIPDPYGAGSVELVRDIAKRAKAVGKHAAAFTVSSSHANLVCDMGYQLVSIAMDGTMIAAGAAKAFENLDF